MFLPTITWALAFLVWAPVFAPTSQRDRMAKVDAETIEFREFFESGVQELKPSTKLLGLH